MNKGLNIASYGENVTISKQKKASGKSGEFNYNESFVKDNTIKLDITYILNSPEKYPFISKDDFDRIAPEVIKNHILLSEGKGDCMDGNISMLGWQSFPDEIANSHLDDITNTARTLSNKIDAFVSLGIGGSYLGIEATFKALTHNYYNQLSREDRGGLPEFYFLGQNMDPDYFRDTLDMLKGKRVAINVISKSGTTTETAIAFRIMRDLIEKWAGDKSSEYIFATTDKARGALKKLADEKRYKTYVVPDDIGGRFSVLTDVGLFSLAVGGIDIYEFVAGFRHMKKIVSTDNFMTNPSMVHAAIRHLAFTKGKKIDVVAANSASIYQLTRWMEQLFPESEGHEGHGMWVSPTMYSEKLHANGQMVQDGERDILETFIRLLNHDNSISIPSDQSNLDGLNYLSDGGKNMNFVNNIVVDAPAYAHFQGGVPNMIIDFPRRNAFNIGQLYYMMEKSVALSGYLMGHNPFTQPGVEAYKKAMFAMAGKPGSEKDKSTLDASIKRLKRIII